MQAALHSRMRTARHAGFTLIELLVAMVVGLVIVMALMKVTTNFESSKRQAEGNTAMGFNAGFISYDIDRQMRSAGSGFLTNYAQALGCTLNVNNSSVGQVLPLPSALAAPFASVPLQVRLIPVLIHAGIGAGGSDVVAIMGSSAGEGESAIQVRSGSPVGATQVSLKSTVGVNGDDMLLLIENKRSCMMTQVATSYATNANSSIVPLAGAFFSTNINGHSLTDYGAAESASMLMFGNATNNRPVMMLYGVDTDHTLYGFDLLRATSTARYAVARDVQDLRALYGVDTNDDGIIDTWKKPTDTGYTVADLTAGTPAAQTNLVHIRAVRIAMVVHSDRLEKPDIVSAPSSLPLFSDLPSQAMTITLTGTDLQRHYKVVDFTIPLRNALTRPLVDPTTLAAVPTQAVP